ncbi:Phage integrase family protein [Lacunisphaera limnophila]|uniref:Phage integrase family protein n=1 Tax=Lacunisphaera limnophila TaxID=1838286 RepID=A0A1D8ATY6_9BACT|nr:tyrosine-type recombinase/integrase [Lacunisphaera limnophila]AOS44351.1 Phage integrase family protein [Lacunisphaera limnophila]
MNNILKYPIVHPLKKSGQKVAKKKPRPSDLKSWAKRVKQNTKSYYGKNSPGDYMLRVKIGGRRKFVGLMTNDLSEAARRAQQFHWDAKSSGWDAAMKRLLPAPPKKDIESLTLEEYFNHIESLSLIDPHTLFEYRAKCRTLFARCLGITGKGSDKWPGAEGRTPWQKRIESIRLSQLTPELISTTMCRYLESRGKSDDPLAKLRAKHTINALVRGARSVFSRRRIIPYVKIQLPAVLPFDGVRLFKEDDAEFRFVKEIEPQVLIDFALEELAGRKPIMFAIFLLCLGAGLRRNEADKLRWMDVRAVADGAIVEVARTAYQKGKSKASLRKVRIPQSFYNLLHNLRGNAADGDFVLPSNSAPRANVTYRHYRCDSQFKALCGWLKSKGLVHDTKALHTLRKLFGDAICNSQGIYSACKALGHQKVSTTERHYAALPNVDPVPFHINAQ